jgi:hypothetical protein
MVTLLRSKALIATKLSICTSRHDTLVLEHFRRRTVSPVAHRAGALTHVRPMPDPKACQHISSGWMPRRNDLRLPERQRPQREIHQRPGGHSISVRPFLLGAAYN